MATDSGSTTSGVRALGWYVVLIGLSIVVLAPVYLVLIRAFSTPVAALKGSPLTVHDAQWDVFQKAFDQGHLGPALLRSLFVTLLITGGQLFTAILAAYAFAFLRFPAKSVIFGVFMATLLLPVEVTLLPNVHTIRDFGWLNSYQGLAVPFMASALGTFLIRQGFRGIPSELRDATKLDGYGHLRFLFQFAVPLTRPVIASFTVISALGAWNQYLWPRSVIDDGTPTAQITLRSIVGTQVDSANLSIAAALIVALPVVLLLIAFQKQIIRGLTAGAVKG